MKRVELLRNQLAHAQELTDDDWNTVVALCANLDRVLGI